MSQVVEDTHKKTINTDKDKLLQINDQQTPDGMWIYQLLTCEQQNYNFILSFPKTYGSTKMNLLSCTPCKFSIEKLLSVCRIREQNVPNDSLLAR